MPYKVLNVGIHIPWIEGKLNNMEEKGWKLIHIFTKENEVYAVLCKDKE